MTNYVSQPVVMRVVNGIAVEQDGAHARVNGLGAACITTREEILSNPRHSLRTAVASIMPKIETGEIVAIVSPCSAHLGAAAPSNGRPTQITLTAEQFALGAGERARYAAWVAGVKAAEQAERSYDQGANEGGEGYNPHRPGSTPTYRGRD